MVHRANDKNPNKVEQKMKDEKQPNASVKQSNHCDGTIFKYHNLPRTEIGTH